jgi:hypothetical protein
MLWALLSVFASADPRAKAALLAHRHRVRDTPIAYLHQEVERLTKARDDIAARRDSEKQRYEDDVKEIDRLIAAKKQTGSHDIADEVAGVESEASLLKSEAAIFAKNNDTRAASVGAESEQLEEVRASLQNTTDGFEDLVPRITQEGEAFYQAAQRLDKQVKLLEPEIKAMERKLMDAEEKEDGEGGMLDSIEDGDEEDSARSLESALGWKEEDLESRATSAENALHSAINHKPVMGALMGSMLR